MVMNPNTHTDTQFGIGERVWWSVGKSTHPMVILGLFIQDNGDGTSRFRIYQREHLKCLAGEQDIENSLLNNISSLPEGYESIL